MLRLLGSVAGERDWMDRVGKHGLHEHVIGEIGRRIVAGEFRPGEALPSEAKLVETLGVSRTALREALRVLSAKGLVEAKQKKGTMVRSRREWNFLDPDVFAWRLDTKEFERVLTELHELRYFIEPNAASLAAEHATATDLEALTEAYREMEACAEDGQAFVGPDVRFHLAIIAASGNSLLMSLGQIIGVALRAYFAIGIHNPEGQLPSLPYHKAVLDAIAAHNTSGARRAMERVVEHSERDASQIRSWRNLRTREKRGKGRAPQRAG
jgi:DNA-binding FadR family transcriptional regulator